MNLKARFPNFTVWSRAKGDIERVTEIWDDCLQRYGGPFLFGKTPTLADAMYAPVATRFVTYDVALDDACAGYCQTIMALPMMQEWRDAAKGEPDDIEEWKWNSEGCKRPGKSHHGEADARCRCIDAIPGCGMAALPRRAAGNQRPCRKADKPSATQAVY